MLQRVELNGARDDAEKRVDVKAKGGNLEEQVTKATVRRSVKACIESNPIKFKVSKLVLIRHVQ